MDSSQGRTSQGPVPVSVGVVSDTGLVRDANEDAYGHFSPEGDNERLFVVADGMGGHKRGREASSTTISVIRETFFGERNGCVLDRLRRAFHRANSRVYTASEADENDGTMGTTATALALVKGTAYIAHVGDSRAYLYRSGDAEKLTCDHTVVRELRRQGAISEKEARTHPRRGMLTRAVGAKSTVQADLTAVGALHPNDRFLLCTDGLEDLSEDAIREVVLEYAPQSACEELVRRANDGGGQDNSTAMVVHIVSP